MDDKTYYSTLGEIKVATELTKQRFHVFNQLSGKAPVDLIALKDNKVYRISVKTCLKMNEHDSYLIQLRKIRSSRHKNTIHLFDKNECDVLAVYLVDCDKVCFIEAKIIEVINALTIKRNEIENMAYCPSG